MYGTGGEILAETGASGNTLPEYFFFGGKRVAILPAGGNAQYYIEDLLGSSRAMTQNHGTPCYDPDFDPLVSPSTSVIIGLPLSLSRPGRGSTGPHGIQVLESLVSVKRRNLTQMAEIIETIETVENAEIANIRAGLTQAAESRTECPKRLVAYPILSAS